LEFLIEDFSINWHNLKKFFKGAKVITVKYFRVASEIEGIATVLKGFCGILGIQ